jgi:hypothetical protein
LAAAEHFLLRQILHNPQLSHHPALLKQVAITFRVF